MSRAELLGVGFSAVNTDAQALLLSDPPHNLCIGDKVRKGLGSSADPVVGRNDAEDAGRGQGGARISDVIALPGLIKLGFADVTTIMRHAGSALMAIGHGSGESRAGDAARQFFFSSRRRHTRS